MNETLDKKLSKVKDDHAAEIVDQRSAEFDEKARAEAYFLLGRIKQNDHIAVAISTNLTAQTIRALEHFQEEGMYKTLGFTTFVDFLEKSEYAPMSKRQYYERRELLNAHGDEVYDLLTSVGISVRAQKLLGKGELAIKGDTLVIGDKEVEIKNTGVIKDVLNELFDDRRRLSTETEKLQKTVEKQKQTIETGSREYGELQRNLDALRARNPHDTAVSSAVSALLNLTEFAGSLSDKDKAAKGKDTVDVLFGVILRVRDAYGINTPLSDTGPNAAIPANDLDRKIAAVIAEEDDLDVDDLN